MFILKYMYMYIDVCISYMSWHTCQYNIVMSVVKRASCSGEREGEERGGPKGGGRERRERDGDSRDSGGQKRYSGNAWSRGRPRISSGDGPLQMKKYEEPQMPVSLNINDLKCSANLLLSLSVFLSVFLSLSLSLSLSPPHTHTPQTFSQPSRFAALQQDTEDVEDNDPLPSEEEVKGQKTEVDPSLRRDD